MARTKKDTVQLYVEINGEKVARTMADMRKKLRSLKQSQDQVTKGGKDWKAYQAQIDKLNKAMGRSTKATTGHAKAVQMLKGNLGQMGGVVGSMPGLFGAVGKAMRAAMAPLFVLSLISNLVELIQTTAMVTQELQRTREEVNRLTGLSGERLSKFTADVTALARTFNQELNPIIEASNIVTRAWGDSFEDSLARIEKGLIIVGEEKGPEFLKQIEEYGALFEEAGYSAEQTFAIIAGGISTGAFNDKLADSIKEFGIKLTTETSKFKAAVSKEIGEDFANDLIEGVETAEITTAEALGKIAQKMDEFGAQSIKTKRLASELFGAPGEDVSKDFLVSLQNANQSLDGLIDSTNIYVQRQLEQLELEKELAAAQEELSVQFDGVGANLSKVWTKIKIGFTRAFSAITQGIKYFPERWKIARIKTIEHVNKMVERIEKKLNALLLPIQAVFKLLGQEPPEIKLGRFKVDKSSAQAQLELQEKINADREGFYKEQERQTLAAINKNREAERLAELKAAKERSSFLRKEAEARAKLYQETELNITRLRLDAMEDGLDKELALRKQQTEDKKRALKGSADQIKTQTELLERKLQSDLAQIRVRHGQTEIKRLQAEAKTKIDQLTGSAEEIKDAQLEIEKGLSENIRTLLRQEEQVRTQQAIQHAQERSQALGDQEAQLQEQIIRINQETTQELTRLRSLSDGEILAQYGTTRDQLLEEITQEAQLKKTVLTRLTEETAKALIEIERQTQQKIQAIKLESGLSQTQREAQISQIESLASAQKSAVIENSQELMVITQDLEEEKKEIVLRTVLQRVEDQTNIEKGLSQELVDIKKDSQAQLRASEEAITAFSLSEAQKRYQEALKLEEAKTQDKVIQATKEAVLDLERGKESQEVERALKEELLRLEREFLAEKQRLGQEAGLVDLDTDKALQDKKLELTKSRIEKEAQAEREASDQRTADFEKSMALMGQALQGFSDLNQAQLDLDLSRIEANKKRELELAGDNEEAKQKIEDKFDDKKAAAERKAAQRANSIRIAQTIANTAESIVKTGATLGYPLAIPFQLIAAAVGTKQLQAIRASESFAGGGYTGEAPQGVRADHTGHKPVGYVHEGEWVATKKMVDDPRTGPIIEELDRLRLRGFASGGYTSQASAPAGISSPGGMGPGGSYPFSALRPMSVKNISHFYADGGYVSTTPADPTVSTTALATDQNKVIEAIEKLGAQWQMIKFVSIWGEKEAQMNAELYGELQARISKTS